eukprot:800549_1
MAELSSTNASVSLTATFSFPEGVSAEIKQKFDDTNCEVERVGLPVGAEAVKPLGGDYSYSGVHDHGKLPEPKEGGDIALLLNMVKKAQEGSDELLTRIIKEEKNAGRKPKDAEDTKKKQKK